MPARKPPSESVLARAAEARADGRSWETVAHLVRRSPHTVRKWPHTYARRWAAALRIAERATIDYAAAESLIVLQTLLRSKDDKIRALAAWRLMYQQLELHRLELKAAAQLAPEPPSDAHRIAEFVKAHTHEQLCKLAANVLRIRLPGSLGAPEVLPPGEA
jgi:hypothetical protein